MSTLSSNWTAIGYLVAAVCFILALKGLSSPRTARRGNLIGAFGAVLAVLVAFFSEDMKHIPLILVAIAVGVALGVPAARRVAMTQMPQLVALFNGVGGGAAALVAVLELTQPRVLGSAWVAVGAGAFTVIVGSVSFAGSVVTFAKLQELMTGRADHLPGPAGRLRRRLSVARVVLGGVLVATGGGAGDRPSGWLLGVLALVSLVAGVLFVLPVGGADVPIVISLLNAFTGLTVAASGYVLNNTLLLVAGTLVGASGTILTRMMASAMGRSVASILFGAFRGGSTASAPEPTGADRPVRSGSPTTSRSCWPTPARSSSCRATGWRWRRPSTPCASWPSCSRRAASR